DIDDRDGNERFDNPRWESDKIERRKRQRNRMSSGEGSDDLRGFAEAAAYEKQRQQEGDMIETNEDVFDSECQKTEKSLWPLRYCREVKVVNIVFRIEHPRAYGFARVSAKRQKLFMAQGKLRDQDRPQFQLCACRAVESNLKVNCIALFCAGC